MKNLTQVQCFLLFSYLLFSPLFAQQCDVTTYGAKGDGKTNDAPAINKCISACSTITFSKGFNFLSTSIHLKSNIELVIESGATITAAATGYDPPENNPYDQYQDYGHSHFHNALIWGENLTNITFSGTGVIDGKALISGTPTDGQADKMISLATCSYITIKDLTLKSGGHFILLANNITYLTITGIIATPHRDGLDIVSSSNVYLNNVSITGGEDDAIAVKSDYALGAIINSRNHTYQNSLVGSKYCNGLQIGSETVGDFTAINFTNIKINSAGKSAIGITAMDGGRITNIQYKTITMDGVATPFFFYIGARGYERCPPPMRVGTIDQVTITDLVATNVIGTDSSAGPVNYTATIDGQPVATNVSTVHPATNMIFTNVNISYPGGGEASDVNINPPHSATAYTPKDMGTRPSYGWFIRNAINITFNGMNINYKDSDGRPGVIESSATDITYDHFEIERGKGLAYDIGLENKSTATITNSPNVVDKDM